MEVERFLPEVLYDYGGCFTAAVPDNIACMKWYMIIFIAPNISIYGTPGLTPWSALNE